MKSIVKGIAAIVLAGSVMLSVAACANFNLLTYKEFKSALEESLEMDDDDYTVRKKGTYEGYEIKHSVAAIKGKCRYMFVEFDDQDDAVEYFEDVYDIFEDAIKDEEFDGNYKKAYSESSATGYILVDGKSDATKFIDGKCYGGIFLKENTIVVVMANSQKSSDIEKIDAMLDAIGYPKP